jgi:CelD/BcsL family acetyltransferase involved in cellulose biosynthesis
VRRAPHRAPAGAPRAAHGDEAGAGTLRTRVIEQLAELEQLSGAWDELAVAAGCPGALSGWQLAWWRQLAPPGARLRAIAVHDADRLVGIAPFWVERARGGRAVYRLLAAQMTHRIAPLASDARAAREIARVLAGATPSPDYVAFDAAAASNVWQSAVRAGWPGRAPWELRERTLPAPVLDLPDGSFEQWLGGKSRNFRQQTRRFRRRLEEAGGVVRMSRTVEELERDVDAFSQLHHERWDARGGSSLRGDVGAMLRDAGRALLPAERFRLWIVELDGRPVSAQIFLAAGGEVLYWNGGFDERAADFKPALLGIIAGIEDCFARGDRRLDLGGGAHDYKQRLADRDEPLAWGGLVPRNARYLGNRAALAPLQARGVARRAFRRLPPEMQERVRGWALGG